MEENKKSKKTGIIISIILIIILAVALGVSVYFVLNSNVEIESKQEEISKLNTVINTLTNQVEDYSKQLEKSKKEETKQQETKNEAVPEMTLELAYGILNKYKAEKLPDANWYISKVTLVAHGDNNTYWVAYEDYNLDGYEEKAGAIIEYKNGKWVTDLPGFSGTDEEMIKKYNFVNY